MIPSTLYECIRLARHQLSEEDLEVIANTEREDLIDFHLFSLGMSIRNSWLWPKGSVLREKFFGVDVIHPDDASSIIIETIWLDLNGHQIIPSTLRELVGWSGQSRYDRKEEDSRLLDILGTADSES